MNLLSVFGGGLFIIPIITAAGMVIFAVLGIKASKSGSTVQNRDGSTTQSSENVPFYKTGYGIFSIILLVALIVEIILMVSDK